MVSDFVLEKGAKIQTVLLGIENKIDGLYEVFLKSNEHSSETDLARVIESLFNMSHPLRTKMGHASPNIIQRAIPFVSDINIQSCSIGCTCNVCGKAKSPHQCSVLCSKESTQYKKNLDSAHFYNQGPINVKNMSGTNYFMPFLDDTSEFSMIGLMNIKQDTQETFKDMITQIEQRTENQVKMVQGNISGELLSKTCQIWIESK